MGIINKTVDQTIDDTNKTIDYEIDETNRTCVNLAQDMNGVGYGAIANALVEEPDRTNKFEQEVERRKEEERMEMMKKQQRSSFEQAVQEKEESLQVRADQKGLRSNTKQHERDLVR